MSNIYPEPGCQITHQWLFWTILSSVFFNFLHFPYFNSYMIPYFILLFHPKRCLSIPDNSLLYVLWLNKKQVKRKWVQGAQEEVTRPEGRGNKYGSPLTQSSASVKYTAQGNAALYIKHLLMALACSHTHPSNLWSEVCLAHTGSNSKCVPQYQPSTWFENDLLTVRTKWIVIHILVINCVLFISHDYEIKRDYMIHDCLEGFVNKKVFTWIIENE